MLYIGEMSFLARRSVAFICLCLFSTGFSLCPPLHAFQADSSLYSGMKWRSIGPFRAGRVSAIAGIPGNSAIYYMASPGGGVWKTTDGGAVWKPIFDQMPVASVGALVVSPSNPDVIYVGTGDVSLVGGAVNMGNGIYKSADAGRTWTHIGLENSEHSGAMWIDPQNSNVVVVAALGRTYSRNAERGIFKTSDGGKTWRKVLYTDNETGGIDVNFAPDNSRVGYAALWHHIGKPANPRQLIEDNSGGGIYKTADGGDTWTQLHLPDVPDAKLGRIGVATAMKGQRVFAIVSAAGHGRSGLYRSDDGGTNWRKITKDPRVTGNGYFSRVFLDPKNPDVVYVAQTSLYRSVDGGRTFISYKGAPGGDDNHALWIDPTNSARMIMASDQGATISMDTGKTWSSWYNQPTGQIYHLSTDNRWPYWVYGTQQDSGSVGTLSRGDYGEISFLDWDPVAAYEFGYIVPDPSNPNRVFAGGPARGLVLVNRTNRQVETISPNLSRDGDYRLAMNPPLAFSPQDPHVFYEGTQFLMETRDAGKHWANISPDLTTRPGNNERNQKGKAEDTAEAQQGQKLKTREANETLKVPNRSAINTFSPSPIAAGEIWVGTTNGLIQLTRDGGKSWQQISPSGLSEYSIISIIEASHFDPAVAYAAVDRHEENDFRPHIYCTADFGKSWQEVVAGIPDGDFVRVVREDPTRKGLLYAGTENSTYVSFDDGSHWNSLQLNMPTASVRDLQVRDNDLVAATYGRAFWILDDLSPLRQIDVATARQQVLLYRPSKAIRVQFDLNGDTPLPPEMPAAQNPPDGALLDYYLKTAPTGDISLSIYDSAGKLVREFSSKPQPPSTEPPPNVPNYWLARVEPLPKSASMNRFLWDLRYAPPLALHHDYPISAVYENTHPEPQGALVVPGTYEVRLTVDGKTYRQPLTVVIDPRVSVSQAALERQFLLERKIANAITASYGLNHQAVVLREAIAGAEKKLQIQSPDTVKALEDFDKKAAAIQGTARRQFPPLPGKPKPTFMRLNGELSSLATVVDSADSDPTPAMESTYAEYCRDLTKTVGDWSALLKGDLIAVNAQLEKQKMSGLPAAEIVMPMQCD
jgi:photosystem II stability/assembly factor-like uncharacterized protein